MSKTIRRGMLGYAGLMGLGALLMQASVAAAATPGPVTIKLARGYGGPYAGPDEAIENASPAAEQETAAVVEKNGETYVVIAWMSGDVPDNLAPNQVKCTSMRLDPKAGPVLVADQVYLTQNENTDRPGNRPFLHFDGVNLIFSYGYAPNNGNTRSYVRLINEQCQSISDTLKVSNNDNENIGTPFVTSFSPGRLFVTYYSNNGNQLRGRLVTVDGATLTKGENRGLVDPSNIGRGPIAASNGYAMTCTGRGNQRPPEDGIACTLIDSDGNVVWKNQIVADANPDADMLYNQATVVTLDAGRFGLIYQETNGNGKNTNDKGSNISHMKIFEPTAQGPNEKAHTSGFSIYGTHATVIPGMYGENGDRVLGVFESSPTDSGPAALTLLRYDSAALSFKTVDTAMDQWIASIGASDSGKLSNMYGNNPNDQGRNFLHGVADVRNPGFGVEGGWMSDVETFWVLPYDGRVAYPPTDDEPKNASYVTFLPGKTLAAVPPSPPQEAPPPPKDNPNVQPGQPEQHDPGAGPDPEAPEVQQSLKQPEAASACSVSAPGTSDTAGGLAALGLALLGFAASRRRKES